MLFHYRKTRKQIAIKVGINILFLPLMTAVFWLFGHQREGFEQIFDIAIYAIVATEVFLMGYGVWLLLNPAQFEICLTPEKLSVHHPTFSQWNLEINPNEIKSIDNIVGSSGYHSTVIRMHDGTTHSLCPNYNYSRNRLYNSLKSINTAIEIPKSPNLFSRRRSKTPPP